MKEVKLSEDKRYLIDSDGIRFKRPRKPLATIEVKVSTANPHPIRIDTKTDFVNAIKRTPKANTYLNLGPIPEKRKIEIKHSPYFGTITSPYIFYQIDLYHLGL